MAKIPRTALVLDNGLFQPLAHRLVGSYEKVCYFRPWIGSFPHPNDYYCGSGYEFERIESYEQYFEDENVTWIFPDLHFPALQKWLRSKGRAVWGAGYGEDLELMRAETKGEMEEIGLPLKPWESIIGMTALREYLEKHENVFVKVSKCRGLCETFHSESYELVKPKLDEIEHDLGGRSEVQEFVVEQPVEDAVEVGYDGWCIAGQYPRLAQVGVEIKDCCYAAKIVPYTALPRQVLEVNRKLAPLMKEYGYCGFFSTEVRIGKDKQPYLIDVTARHASPAGESLLKTVENLPEIIEAGAHGKIVEIKPKSKFVCQAMLCSDFAMNNWLPIEIPKEIREHVHLYHSCMVGKMEYVIPVGVEMPQIGSVTAVGATPEEAIKTCQGYVKRIKAYGLKDNTDKMMDAVKELAKV